MRRALVAMGIAAGSAACSLFVNLDGLNGGTDAGDIVNGDASFSDVLSFTDSTPPRDGSIVTDSGVPFSCAATDATFCDDFNRDAALASALWKGEKTDVGCHLSVDGTLVTNADPVTTDNGFDCFLYSQLGAQGRHFTLDFDVTMTSDVGSQAVVLAELDNNLDAVNAAGVLSQSFQLLVEGNGNAKIGMLEYFPDAAASPDPGNSYPYWNMTANDGTFMTPSKNCHVQIVVDAVTPTATATATCADLTHYSLPSIDTGVPQGFSAKPNLLFGYNNTGATTPAWNVTYDNMVFRAAP